MHEISLFGQTTSVVEMIAMLTGLAGVWLTIRQSPWCFPVGIVNVAIYSYLFFSPGVQLYADALLQCVYILLLIYGWYRWTTRHETDNTTAPVNIDASSSIKVLIVVSVSTCILGFFLSHYTNASFPWLDSALTCISLAAQWMVAKKHIENWIVWIVVDLVYVPLYLVKHLPLTALLYAIFMLMAVKGYRDWKLHLRHE